MVRNNYKLDKKDRKLLYELDINCRRSSSTIGKKIGLSKQAVEYRIKKLLKEGIIKGFSTVINTYKLGYLKFKIFLALQDANREKIEEIIEYFKKHKRTEWVAECSGKWDIIVGYIVKDMFEFNDALFELLNKFSKYIAEKETNVSLGVLHYRKEYISNRKIAIIPVIKQVERLIEYKPDTIDTEILKIIANNARMSVVSMSSKIKTTPRIIQYRIKNLYDKDILLIHRSFLDLNKLGYIFCKANLYLKNLTKERLKLFLNYCASHPNITYVISCIGPWELEIEFEIENFNRFHKNMQEIKDKFSYILKKYDYVIIIREHKFDYFPESYSAFL